MAAMTEAHAASGSVSVRAADSHAMPSSTGRSRRSTSPSVYRQSTAPGGKASVLTRRATGLGTPMGTSEETRAGAAGWPGPASRAGRCPALVMRTSSRAGLNTAHSTVAIASGSKCRIFLLRESRISPGPLACSA